MNYPFNSSQKKKCRKCTHPQTIQNIDEFVSSSEKIWINVSLCHFLTNESFAVDGCRYNESPNIDKKHHKNPQVIHMYMKEWRKLEVSESIQIKSQ